MWTLTGVDSQEIESFLSWLEQQGERLGPWGDCRQGEIQIATNPIEAQKCLLAARHRLSRQAGLSPEQILTWSRIGVVFEDQYIMIVRDPVLFPPQGGVGEPGRGTYIRVLYRNSLKGNLGIFALVVDEEGKLILNRCFRHACRRWTLEGQGTIARDGETREQSLERCIRNEVARSIKETRLITDHFVSDRGLIGQDVPMYLVRVGQGGGELADQTVAGHVVLGVREYQEALRRGDCLEVAGIPHYLIDSYTMGAVQLATLRGLI